MSESIFLGTMASLIAGGATGLGGLVILLPQSLIKKLETTLLGLCIGVMLAATAFSLIVPGIEFLQEKNFSNAQAALVMVIGMSLGWQLLHVANKALPLEKFFQDRDTHRKIWLFIVAITIHNFPEGMAVGVGFATGEISDGIPVTIGIGLQNIPEGLAVALAMMTLGYSRLQSMGMALLSGLVEPIGSFIGVAVVSLSELLLPWGLAFASGVMLIVIMDEIIPEIHEKGFSKKSSQGIMIGFMLMMFLDIALG